LTVDVFVTCPGTPGHGSLMLPDTAGEKVEIIINKFMDLRRREKKKLESNKNLTVGDVTSVNLTQIKVSARFILLSRETDLTITT
jgi:aminoacylase